MTDTPAPKGNKTVIIVIVVLVVALIALIAVAVALFVNVSVAEPRDIEIKEEPPIAELDEPRIETSEDVSSSEEEGNDTSQPGGDSISLTIEEHVLASAMQGDGIYLLSGASGALTVIRVSTEDGDMQTMEIPWGEWWPWVEAFSVTDDGNFLFLFLEYDLDTGQEIYLLAEYDATTGDLTYQDVTAAMGIDPMEDWVASAIFDPAGNLIFSEWSADGDEAFFVLGRDGSFRGEVDLEGFSFWPPVRARDGQMVMLGWGASWDDAFGNVLREIDADTVSLSEEVLFSDSDLHTDSSRLRMWSIYGAEPGAPFDLYVDVTIEGEHILHGFDLATGELTLLFDWEELAVVPDWGDDVFFLANRRIAVLEHLNRRDNFWAELTIFMP